MKLQCLYAVGTNWWARVSANTALPTRVTISTYVFPFLREHSVASHDDLCNFCLQNGANSLSPSLQNIGNAAQNGFELVFWTKEPLTPLEVSR
jgi:hypothetical protein